jgi:hypothetical protein
MVNKAIIVENKIKEMEKNGKRKTSFSRQSSESNTRPHLPQSGPFFKKPEYGSLVDAWTTSSIPYATTKLSGAAPELPDAETSATGSSTQCVATVSPERTARPSPNSSNLT